MENNNSEFKVPSLEEATQFRSQFLKDYPYQEAFEQLAEEYSEVDGCDLVECIMWTITMDLRLTWAAARAMFGDMATPELALKLNCMLKKELERIDAEIDAEDAGALPS